MEKLDWLFRTAFNLAETPLLVLDTDGTIIQCNRSLTKIFQLPQEKIVNQNLKSLIVVDDHPSLTALLWQPTRQEQPHVEVELHLATANDPRAEYLFKIVWVQNDKGGILGLCMVHDISAWREATRQAAHHEFHDPLTGLPNRPLFLDRLEQELNKLGHQAPYCAVVFCDLDLLRRINERLGHSAGDFLLQTLAKRLTDKQCYACTVARLGSDEFGIILPGIQEPEDVSSAIARIIKEISEPFEFKGETLDITASLGIAIAPLDGQDVDTLLKNAEQAMIQAKELGRNGYQFYSTEVHAKAAYNQLLEYHLRHAIKNDELFLNFQPQMGLDNDRLIGSEALLRWRNPMLGLIGPDKFIPLAEESNLIIELGEWVLRKACQQVQKMQQEGLPTPRVAINVSGRQFHQPEFVTMVRRVLTDSNLQPDLLELELTESCLMDNPEQARKILQELKSYGIQIAVDDFGTGYSSLSYLKYFPLDRLKIDRSFIRDVTNNTDDAKIVEAIIILAHTLGLSVIAEGVETIEQLEFLRNRGCDEIQGYWFGKPMDTGTFLDFCREQNQNKPLGEKG